MPSNDQLDMQKRGEYLAIEWQQYSDHAAIMRTAKVDRLDARGKSNVPCTLFGDINVQARVRRQIARDEHLHQEMQLW